MASNAKVVEKGQQEVLCQPCKKMKSHLDQHIKMKSSLTPEAKVARLEPSSTCPLSALSPASKAKRKNKVNKERYVLKQKLEHLEVKLDDNQSNEIANIMNTIDQNASASHALADIFSEAQSQSSSTMEDIWKQDMKLAKQMFNKDQATNGVCFYMYTYSHASLITRAKDFP